MHMAQTELKVYQTREMSDSVVTLSSGARPASTTDRQPCGCFANSGARGS